MSHLPRRVVIVVAAGLLLGSAVRAQPSQTLSLPPESSRWELEGQAKATEYQGRKCLFLDGGVAIVKDLEMRDGVIDVDVATPASRGFFGIDFRLSDNGANGERVYLRQHKSGDDVSVFVNGKILYRGRSAQGFRDPGFLGIVNPENDAVYIPLKKGRNELMLAVSELGGGWGFICRLSDPES